MASPITTEQLNAIQDAFNTRDVDLILSYFTEDCVWLMARGPDAPEGRRCTGKAAIGAVLSTRYQEIPDMRWEEMRHWIFDDSKALSEWVVRGTPRDSEPFEYLGCDLWEFREAWSAKRTPTGKTIE
ncbi:MAG: hypothetical protein Ct9H300mP16_01770 [Pseudomonadota bacterium]|nr:MAG: hypothetical protein Ct9H300mP16_01770 [Pseudomonadota bacterium]